MPGLVLEVIVTAFYCFLRSVINRHFGTTLVGILWLHRATTCVAVLPFDK